jgi:hypothetical protein
MTPNVYPGTQADFFLPHEPALGRAAAQLEHRGLHPREDREIAVADVEGRLGSERQDPVAVPVESDRESRAE